VILIRKVIGLLLLVCCAGALVAPAAARESHGIVHAQAPVAVGEHHRHSDPAPSEVSKADFDESAGQSGKKLPDQTGHSHMPSSAVDLAFPFPEQLQVGLRVRSDAPSAADTPALATLSWLPLIRPPITA